MKTEQTAAGEIELWSADEVATALRAGEIVLIDVRTPQEFALERIEGALLAPLASVGPESMPAQSGKRLVLHCGSGARSGRSAQALLAAGAGPAAHMEGGLTAWKQRGLPYIGTDMATGAPKGMKAGG